MNRLLAAAALAALAGCGPSPDDPKKQIGAHPTLPEPHQYLFPPMHVVDNVGWGSATPKVAAGLEIKALAKDAGVEPEQGHSHHIVLNGDAGSFTDPDGFVWAS